MLGMENASENLDGKTTLFLHMGPGLTAGVERVVLGPLHPEVDYWDQPLVSGLNAFTDLVNAALARAELLAENNRGKVHLVAHSFGGHIAREICELRPKSVASLTLFNTGFDVVGGFHSLLNALARDPGTPAALRKSAIDFLLSNPVSHLELLWPMFGIITQDPNFMRLYWKNEALFLRHQKLSANLPPFAFQTYQDALNSFLKTFNATPKQPSWDGPVHLVLGDSDPTISAGETITYWQTVFPKLTTAIRKKSCHFTHLEDELLT